MRKSMNTFIAHTNHIVEELPGIIEKAKAKGVGIVRISTEEPLNVNLSKYLNCNFGNYPWYVSVTTKTGMYTRVTFSIYNWPCEEGRVMDCHVDMTKIRGTLPQFLAPFNNLKYVRLHNLNDFNCLIFSMPEMVCIENCNIISEKAFFSSLPLSIKHLAFVASSGITLPSIKDFVEQCTKLEKVTLKNMGNFILYTIQCRDGCVVDEESLSL